ncbi:putative membrane protein YhaJ [Lentibacillus sp. JNUCC-1]|uniref:DUF3267 domain-containing protein n=1 Tax=Lentibacillus sp. JNUCC-1 TaxID=2654513 RepID=UPI0012E8924C|nr:DUF3267 domain-containing protein [Lentibacillus sp. JNUCC-1]MUV36598.1 putative membrane protein YhaJ [Lentibacillus sp. JNUCC-1]
MNCWKSINIEKDYGSNRLYLMSSLIGLGSFIILFVPVSMIHGTDTIADQGMVLFILALVMLPTLHSLAHILPLLITNKPVKIKYKTRVKCLPTFHCYSGSYLSKKLALAIMLLPTLLITIPGLALSLASPSLFAYALVFTALHIGVSFRDFVYIVHILRAPKSAVVENGANDLDILVKMSR